MAAPCFITWNGLSNALTAPLAGAATNATTTVKTMLQVKAGVGKIRVVEWGYRFLAAPTAPVHMELIETGTVFATVTTGNILAYNDVTGPVSLAPTGTAATGFTSTAEGTITASRLLADTLDSGTYFSQQFPLGREPEINAGACLRIRATPGTAAATTVVCYVAWEE